MPESVKQERPRIFVSIAGFCDPLLAFTVEQAVKAARFPGRLSFGIVDQSPEPSDDLLPQGTWRMAYLHVTPPNSRGACWARALAMTLYAGETYFFQVDSHSCFDPGWDETLVSALEAVASRSGNSKVILSTRPFAFEFDEDGSVRTSRFTDGTLKLVAKERVLSLSKPVMSFACYNSKQRDDLRGFQVSAANLFARGTLVEEIPYDPFMYFHGEEQNISIRAYTHGWDIWHPNAVPLYHLYKKRVEGEAPLHWDTKFDEQRQEKWRDLRRRSHARLARLITGELSGAYGLGSERSMDDYLEFAGLELGPEAASSRAVETA